MKPIITEDEIKEYAKNECIDILKTYKLGDKKGIMYFHNKIDKDTFSLFVCQEYEENRNDNFSKWRKHNLTNQMFNQDVIGNDVFDW